MAYQSINPATGRLVESFDNLTDRQLEEKLAAAAICFQSWKQRSYVERAVVIARAAEILRAKADEFAAIVTLEMGKLIGEARGEVAFSADILSYYAKNAGRFLAPEKLHPTVGEAHMERGPIGVVFCVEPVIFLFTSSRASPGRS